MKYLLVAVLLQVSHFISAQPDAGHATGNTIEEGLFRPNSVKFNVYGLLASNYSVSYERMITPRIAVQVGYRYQPYKYITDNFLVRKLAEHGSIDPKYFNFRIGNYAVTIDMRYYFSKRKTGRGVFGGLYGRYAHFDIDNTDYTYTSDKEDIYSVPLICNLNGFGGGILTGVKWLIRKRVIVEFSTGIHYLKLHGPLTSNKDLSGLSGDDKAKLKENIESTFSFNDKNYLTATVSDNGISGNISGPPVGIRSCLSIGIAF